MSLKPIEKTKAPIASIYKHSPQDPATMVDIGCRIFLHMVVDVVAMVNSATWWT